MATRLKNILRFTGLVVGTPVSIAHNLNLDSVAVVPDKSTPQSGSFTVVADATNVTVTRNVGDADNVDVLAEYWHTEDRVFGSDGTPFSQLTPAPFVASPGPGAGQAQNPILKDGSTVNIYVDSVNGLDTNDGLTIATPIQTFTELYTKFPVQTLQRSMIIVNLAGVGGFGASATGVADYDTTNILYGGGGGTYGGTYVYKGSQMVAVTPTTGPATAALDVVPVVAVIGGSAAAGGTRASRFDFTTAAPAWTVNDFRNKHLRITRAGALVIYEAPIASNTADTITVMKNGLAAAPSAILATDTVEIVEPGARFINTTAAALDFDQCRISGVGAGDWDVTDGAPNPAVGGMTFQRVQFRSAPIVRGALGCEFDRCQMGAGGVPVTDSSVYFVSCSAQGVTLHNSAATDAVPLPNPDSATSPIVANRSAFMDLQTYYLNVGDGNSPASYWTFNGMGFAGTANGWDLVFVGPQSYLQCTGDMQGIAGNKVGIRAAAGGHCEVLSNSTAGRTSVEGSAGDLVVGPAGSGTIAYGTGVGDFEEVIGFAGNYQRFPTTPGDLGDASVITTQNLF